jgi:hypothetical protein
MAAISHCPFSVFFGSLTAEVSDEAFPAIVRFTAADVRLLRMNAVLLKPVRSIIVLVQNGLSACRGEEGWVR